MSKLISALLISVSLIASQTVFANRPGSSCIGTDGKRCNPSLQGATCTCRDTIKDDIKTKIKDKPPKASKLSSLKDKS
jgi:hypothetical protein